MRGRRYIAVTVLSWLFILLLGWYFVYDVPRMQNAAAGYKREMASIGAQLYAENCVVCHGAGGQGHVGPALNKEAFRVDPEDNDDIYQLIYRAIDQGRPGTSDPNWVRLTNGAWASYTAMPAWGTDAGGSMNEQMISALAHFIMIGDWSQVSRHIPEPRDWHDENGQVRWDLFPDGIGISAAASQAGKEIFVNGGCAFCHTLGGAGGFIGPDLTKVGSWGLDEEFLTAWIKDPPSVRERMPRYWSNYGGPYQLPIAGAQTREDSGVQTQVSANAGEGTVQDQLAGGSVNPQEEIPLVEGDLPPTQMPPMGLSDEEIEVLVNYLLHLK